MATFRLDDYVVDVLLRDLVGHDHSSAAFVVYGIRRNIDPMNIPRPEACEHGW
jgi:hypothetical protein